MTAAHPSETDLDLPTGLTWCSDDHAGFSRRRAGRAFSYLDRDGKVIGDPRVKTRIKALAIPPAWSDVWICPRANGHIQAIGRDAKGRKQYRYHADWSTHAAESKFDRLPAFARALPRLHARVESDLARCGPCRDKVLATVVRLLELTLIRIGNARYTRQNRSFGLTTLNKRHLEVDGTSLTFAFRGKSGKNHEVSVRDPRLARVIRTLRELPGQPVFQYRDTAGELATVTSDAVNAYIREAMGEAFSAKDFRTWAATVSAARVLREAEPPTSATDARRKITACCRTVSGLLGNTPSVCRSAYIHPKVFATFEAGELSAALPCPEAKSFEARLLRLLAE